MSETLDRDPLRYLSAAGREQVLIGACAYCGDLASVVDHVIPWSRGGRTNLENSAPACRTCNEQKMDSTPEEWRAWREEQGLPWPPVRPTVILQDMLLKNAALEGVTEEELGAYLIEHWRKVDAERSNARSAPPDR